MHYLPARAFDNRMYVVVVNQVGSNGTTEFPGGSMVLNPDGDIIAEAESLVGDLLIADLDASALQ